MAEDESEDEQDQKTANTKTKKAKKRKPAKKEKAKATAKVVAGSAKSSEQGNYKAGDFGAQRTKFIRKRLDVGWTMKEASDDWMLSARRARLLEGMSLAELKRRRFA